MALTLQQISQRTAYKNHELSVYLSPIHLSECLKALKNCNIKSTLRLKFEHGITDNIPNKKKGFYVFTIEEFYFPLIDFKYLLYIGRAQKSNTFKKRFYKYRNAIDDDSVVENVMLLTNLWPENTFVYFFEMDNDDEIQEIEKILINRLHPNFNEEYFTDKTIESTSLYKLAKK